MLPFRNTVYPDIWLKQKQVNNMYTTSRLSGILWQNIIHRFRSFPNRVHTFELSMWSLHDTLRSVSLHRPRSESKGNNRILHLYQRSGSVINMSITTSWAACDSPRISASACKSNKQSADTNFFCRADGFCMFRFSKLFNLSSSRSPSGCNI